ncbi:cell wall metabolism sensor histidine kinase WalK [Cohnella sp. AR92]|uniref:sensor histidine kinase n=1 Tax=Cohnella sp. AR92 TaxID=648716 RepID=UPI001EDF3A99|nr:HAMP domain-containing sensor histidine kinase [Cohnella sp. AR92]
MTQHGQHRESNARSEAAHAGISRHEAHLEKHYRRLQERLDRKKRRLQRRISHTRRIGSRTASHRLGRHKAHLQRRLDRLEERINQSRLIYEERQQRVKKRHQRQLDFEIEPKPKWYQVLLGSLGIFAFFSLCWTAAHFLTRILDNYWTYARTHTTFREYVAILISVFLFGLTIQVVGLIMKPNRRKMINVFTMMIDAMQRMAKGDFNINLETQTVSRHAGQFAILIDNLNRMANELGQMEQMRQEFISNVSHEIQSPLTAIKGFAQALQGNDLSPEQRKHYLEIIETESDRLSRLSDNLLKLTSLESLHHPYQPHSYRLDRQLRKLVLSCEPLWDAKQLELDIQLDELVVTADEELLNQAWSNLLHNSIKFTPPSGQLSIRLEQQGNQAIVRFSDTGIGIDEQHLPHLFERFFKVDRSRNRSAGGSGLGLSIVKKIIEMHGGAIRVASQLGAGTTFTVQLPLTQPAHEQAK